ncbi:hypothetical protein ACVGX0_18790, partial [Enterobacter hormaechei]
GYGERVAAVAPSVKMPGGGVGGYRGPHQTTHHQNALNRKNHPPHKNQRINPTHHQNKKN